VSSPLLVSSPPPPPTPPPAAACGLLLALNCIPVAPAAFRIEVATMSRRPELMSPPEMFYDAKEAKKYTQGSRMVSIQTRLTNRAMQLLNIPADPRTGVVPNSLILDIGCGSALSGDCLERAGHTWIGTDISPDMLNVAVDRGATASCGDVMHGDMGQGFAFRPGMFDGAISISALQWLFYPAKKCHNPHRRLMAFFQSLYSVLHRGARAVLQFYPENSTQMEMALRCATQCGFTGGLVVDYPHSTKAKKYYLTITAGTSHTYLSPVIEDIAEGNEYMMDGAGSSSGSGRSGGGGFQVSFESKRGKGKRPKHGHKKRAAPKSRDWILDKKDRQRRQGKQVRRNTKYSGRKRKDKF
jgi:18S rRNA (guanine1575-N7)-methyltransferase